MSKEEKHIKRTSAKVAKCKVLLWRFALLERNSRCHTESTCDSCPGPQAHPGSHCRTSHNSSKAPAACEQLLGVWASPRAGAKPGNDKGMRTWAKQGKVAAHKPCSSTPCSPRALPLMPVHSAAPKLGHWAGDMPTRAPGWWQSSCRNPTQLPGYLLVNKSCKVFAYIITCYPQTRTFWY